MLTAEEERNLAERLRDHDDLDAARRLILSHTFDSSFASLAVTRDTGCLWRT